MLAAACSTASTTPDAPGAHCGSASPCGCVTPRLGETCTPTGAECTCTHRDAPDASDGAVDPPAAALEAFLGRWSPVDGTGQSDCAGAVNPLPPDPSAVLTFTQSGPAALTATSSGAPGCSLALHVKDGVASLAEAAETCDVPGGGVVQFTTFVLEPHASADGGAPDAGDAGSQDRLDWELGDNNGTCTTGLRYTLGRVP
jgi:hypothetical protein